MPMNSLRYPADDLVEVLLLRFMFDPKNTTLSFNNDRGIKSVFMLSGKKEECVWAGEERRRECSVTAVILG